MSTYPTLAARLEANSQADLDTGCQLWTGNRRSPPSNWPA
jgi:hypothetical protein